MNGCYYNEKTADEMFKELGYEISNDIIADGLVIAYENIDGYIIFDEDKYVGFLSKDEESCFAVDVQDLAAINKMVQELGWKG